MIINRTKDAIPSTATTKDLVEALATLDLSSMPPENRRTAINHMLGLILSQKATDPNVRAELFAERLSAIKRAQ